MTNKEKILMLEDLLDVEEGTLNTETVLDDLAEWDSMAIISLIALFDEEFGKSITASEINTFKKVQDILNVME